MKTFEKNPLQYLEAVRVPLYKTVIGTIFFIIKGQPRSQKAPTTIGRYRLISTVEKKSIPGNYGVGIYESDAKKVFIKTWNGKLKDSNYYQLVNECAVSNIVKTKLAQTKYKNIVCVSNVIEVIQTKNSISVVFEWIEGKNLGECSPEDQVRICENILSALEEVSKILTTEDRNYFTKRTALFHFLSLLAATIVLTFRYPSKISTLLESLQRSFVSMLNLYQSNLVLAHGDLNLENVLIKDDLVYIIDCGGMSLSLPFYDTFCLALSSDIHDSGKTLREFPFEKDYSLIINYIASHSILNSKDDAPVRNYYFSILDKSQTPALKISENFRTTQYTSISDSFRSEWNTLWNESSTANIENSLGWFESACRAFSYQEKSILAIYDENNILHVVVPLIKTRLFGLSIFTAPAREFVNRSTILGNISNSRLRSTLFNALEKLDIVYLECLVPEELHTLSHSGKNSLSFSTDQEPLMDFTQGPQGELSKRKLQIVMNKIKRLPGQTKIVTTTGNTVVALQDCFNIDQISAKHQHGKGVFWKNDVRDFYLLLAEKCPSNMIITLLFCGEKPIAYWINFNSRNTYVGSQKAYLPEYSQYKPGAFSYIKFLESIKSRSLIEVSFGRGLDQFKSDFTKKTRVLSGVVISKHRLTRLYFAFAIQLRNKLYLSIAAHPKLYAGYKKVRNSFNLRKKTTNLYE